MGNDAMHAEYKIPGGKLVVIDLDIADGAFSNVILSGDFFLSPEEALDWITATIEGQPSNSTEAALAERIQIATFGAEMLGITPEGIAIAVRRAVEAVQE